MGRKHIYYNLPVDGALAICLALHQVFFELKIQCVTWIRLWFYIQIQVLHTNDKHVHKSVCSQSNKSNLVFLLLERYSRKTTQSEMEFSHI